MQRLSAAERLHRDASASGRPWQVSFEPAVGHTGAQLFLSSRTPADAARVLSLLSGSVAPGDPAAPLTFAMEEKMVQAPGSWSEPSDVTCSLDLQERAAVATMSVARAAAQVRASCVGGFVTLLTFADAHEANRCLTLHQHTMAAKQGMFLLPVGPTTATFGAAIAKLLPRRTWPPATSTSADKLVRGVIVRVVSSMECIVDCGFFASPASQQSLPVYTQSNHLKIAVGDEVMVEPNVEHPRKGETKPRVTATLRRLLVVPLAATASSPSRAEPTSARALASRLLSGLHARKPAGTTPNNMPITTPSSSQSPESPGGVSYTHRICPFPTGLSLYAELIMRVERIGQDAVFGRVLDAGGHPWWPVVVPAVLLLSGAVGAAQGGRDDDAAEWRRFVVVGERMSVALRYVVAVGGSTATLCCVGSKTSGDMARAVMTRRAVDVRRHHHDEGPRSDAGWTVGTRVEVRPAFRVCPGDIGVPLAGDAGKDRDAVTKYFPAEVMQSIAETTSSETQPLLLLCPCSNRLTPTSENTTQCAGQVGSTGDGASASARTMIISDIVRDARVGHFAVVLSVDAYAARQAEATRQERLAERAERLEIKRRLAAVLGEDAVRDLDKDERETKRPRGTP